MDRNFPAGKEARGLAGPRGEVRLGQDRHDAVLLQRSSSTPTFTLEELEAGEQLVGAGRDGLTLASDPVTSPNENEPEFTIAAQLTP